MPKPPEHAPDHAPLGAPGPASDSPAESPADLSSADLSPEGETSFQLLLRARGGDAEAVDRLAARYLPRLQRWAEGRLPKEARGPLDTGDIVQEVLLRVLARLDRFDPRKPWSFTAYLRRSLMNRFRDEARRAKRHPAAEALDDGRETHEPSPFDEVVGIEGRERYEAALARLRPIDQQAIVTRCEWGLSYEEITPLIGKTSVNATRVAIHRALVRLAKEMADGRRRDP